MTDPMIVFAIIAMVIGLFVWDRLPVIAVCVGCALALWATGVLTLNQALAGFGDPATIFVGSLFVMSAALEKTGVTAWVGQVLAFGAGTNRSRLVVLLMLFGGVLAAFITLNAAVAALLPVAVVLAVRLRHTPSKLLMPLVYGGHAGSMLALTGTPVNVLVLEASLDAGQKGFGYFEFALVGVPLLAGVILIALLFGNRLLPVRESRALPPDLSRHARTLVEQFGLEEGMHELKLRPGSPLIGQRREAVDFEGTGATLVTARDGGAMRLGPLAAGDILLVRGAPDAIAVAATAFGLAVRGEATGLDRSLFNAGTGIAEVLIPPRSPLVGDRLFPGMVTPSGDLVVLSVQRQDADLAPGVPLAVGDTMLLQGTWEALERHLAPPEVIVVNAPELVRRQAVPLARGSTATLLILSAMVALLATSIVPAAVAGLLAAGAVLLLGILSVEEAYRGVNWTTVILVGAMMPLSTAITDTGAARMLADALLSVVGAAGPRALLAGLFLLTAILGQVISNTATALIIIPISVVAAAEIGISPQPVLMAVAVAAAASFLTPVATPTNLMVMEPAGYRFGDYWKFGLPMMIWFFIVAVVLVPLIWPF